MYTIYMSRRTAGVQDHQAATLMPLMPEQANGPTLTATVLVDGSGLVYHKGSLKEALKGALKGSA